MDAKIKQAYKQIKAPESLRERVASLEAANTRIISFPYRTVRRVASIAACFAVVFVIAAVLMLNNGTAGLVIDGESVGEAEMAIAVPYDARSRAAAQPAEVGMRLEFAVECKGECSVTVDCGEILNAKESYRDGDKLVWSVFDVPADGARLQLECGDEIGTYILKQESETGVWTINKQ